MDVKRWQQRCCTILCISYVLKINYKQIPSIKLIKGKGFQNSKLNIWVRNGLKIPHRKKWFWGSLQTILLCIEWELAGVRGLVAVAVGVSDM